MDWIIWLIVIVAIVAIVWWLLNRNNSRIGAGSSTAADTSTAPAAMAAPEQANEPAAMAAPEQPKEPVEAHETVPADEKAGVAAPEAADNAEWETQWSETPAPAETHAAAVHYEPARGEHAPGHGVHAAGTPPTAEPQAAAGPRATAGVPVHHPEYTEPHAPTLPGAESAAAEASYAADVEAETPAAAPAAASAMPEATAPPAAASEAPAAPLAEAETQQTAVSSAASETSASHTAEAASHLALDQPYGEGSAAPAADGSGPEGFTVKGNASSMIYHDETSPSFEETVAEVWFLSPAHAEAAGFRPPRRSRQ